MDLTKKISNTQESNGPSPIETRRDRFQEPAIVRPQAEGEQPQAPGNITMRRPRCRATCRWRRPKHSRL